MNFYVIKFFLLKRTGIVKGYYFKGKDEAKKIVSSALYSHNKDVMSRLVRMEGNSCITI